MSASPSQNAEQITYWNEVSGPKWVELADRIDPQIEPIGRAALDRAKPAPGESVLDVGCGCGQTSLDLAARVGETGRVVGADISAPMLEAARTRGAGLEQLSFLEADAQVHAFPADSFDLVFSRFGVMFFEDPVAAFANLRSALRPEGRLVFACWQGFEHNPWMTLPMSAAAPLLPPMPPRDPLAPGPFAFADADRLRGLLGDAGFTKIEIAAHEQDLEVGRGLGLAGIVDFVIQMGPLGAALREADDEVRRQVMKAVENVITPHFDGDALVLGSACWIVRATA